MTGSAGGYHYDLGLDTRGGRRIMVAAAARLEASDENGQAVVTGPSGNRAVLTAR